MTLHSRAGYTQQQQDLVADRSGKLAYLEQHVWSVLRLDLNMFTEA